MDRIECRRGEEALDRAAWLKAYRDARKRAKRGQAHAIGGLTAAAACLDARAREARRELERTDYRPRTFGAGLPPRIDFFGREMAA